MDPIIHEEEEPIDREFDEDEDDLSDESLFDTDEMDTDEDNESTNPTAT
jgi:hypothetical protein